jgi:NAD(P)-dependent dehydrogenase (short-subunit alcohol dehydrogenase family)
MPLLTDKVGLITGGASGIGRATAQIFAREGAKIAIADMDIKQGEEAAHQICASGGEAIFVQTDVSKAAQVQTLVQTTVDVFGQLDCAFNNAGIFGRSALLADFSEDDWDQIININLKGVWLCMKYEIPHMLERGGAIVNASSVSGLVGSKSSPLYAASKHGVTGLTRTAALQYADQNIRVNCTCPGAIQTPMLEHIFSHNPANREKYTAAAPLGRLAKPEEVGEAVAWLCSDASAYITGVALPVDGGWVAQ